MKLNRASGGPGTERMSREDRENVLTAESSDIGAGSAEHPDKGIGTNRCHHTRKDQQRLLGEKRARRMAKWEIDKWDEWL